MIFYEVEHCDGHFLVATQADAKRIAREMKCTWSQVDVPTDKASLMDYINRQRSLGNQGDTDLGPTDLEAYPSPLAEKNPEISKPDYTSRSIAIDEEWERLPLARKLHFAALAMEDARAQL